MTRHRSRSFESNVKIFIKKEKRKIVAWCIRAVQSKNSFSIRASVTLFPAVSTALCRWGIPVNRLFATGNKITFNYALNRD
jgi:hypothetical protein